MNLYKRVTLYTVCVPICSYILLSLVKLLFNTRKIIITMREYEK